MIASVKVLLVARSCVFQSFFVFKRTLSSLLLLFCLLIPIQTLAQDNQIQDDEVVRVDTNLITAPVFVLDSKNRRIYNLIKTDFQLRDNGRVVEITHFASGAEKVGLMFALDTSGSVRDVIAQERAAALQLARRFGPGSRIAVMQFNDKAELVSPFTNQADQAAKGFDFKAQPNRRTAIFDAAIFSLKAFAQGERDPTERKIIIIISDGLDNTSKARPRQVIEEANRLGVSIYVLHLPLYAVIDGRLSLRSPSKGFRELAQQTGGLYFKLGDEQAALAPRASLDLTEIFQSIEDDLKSQYVLGYYLDDSLRYNPTHKLAVTLFGKDKSKFRVRLLRDTYTLKGK